MGFLNWHKKMLRDDRPIIGFKFETDDNGDKDFKLFVGGSKFHYWKREEKPKTELIEKKKDTFLEE